MILRTSRKASADIERFARREWRNADREHYGMTFPPGKWSREYIIVARDRSMIAGKATLRLKAGVGEIHEVVVAKDRRGQGVGTLLMRKAEAIARKKGAHKLTLDTGKGWRAEAFYRKLGFRKAAILRNHYRGRDFILYEKRLGKA